jgi:Holliday junction DNA helicase RuvA
MIYSLSGKIIAKKSDFVTMETSGIGFKILVSERARKDLPAAGAKTKLFCFLNVHQGGIEIYGFLDEKELELFELLNAAPAIGPKSALAILGRFSKEKLVAAINAGRTDLLAEVSGIGRRKAERLILELKDKFKKEKSGGFLPPETDSEIKVVLKNLGYRRKEIEEALKNLPEKVEKLEERIKLALKILSRK